MVRKLVVTVMIVVFMAATSMAIAGEAFVTKTGKKYHKENCQLIKNKETSKVDDAEAIKQGYVPCAKCYKATQEKQVNK